ncbi:shikimate kinase [Hymenobacter sp. BT175]|uniref:shikimate kinase n=1 Tax=Hymenobacter translucens TaxID=2886507 RepID=UPI001D0EC8ED|nr:shikimate kinase [Hymenobacter translucens]MCC2548826.1 shikimate kinase [Hymenobacter translucens]
MTTGRLFLIGMPGAGKTTLGRDLAAHLGWPFRDLDEEIIREEGRTVAAIFAEEGEAYFRQREADVLRRLVAELPDLVLATGGGTPCFHQNLEVLLREGTALYLEVPVAELTRRVSLSAGSRPLLNAANPEDRLRETFAARRQFYERAPLRCSFPVCSVEAVERLLLRYRTTG